MNLKIVPVGFLQTNCYILEKGNKCLVIDPGDEFYNIKQNIDKEVVGVIITHHHFDHVGALEEVLNEYKCRLYDIHNLTEGNHRISNFFFEVIYTPGHKEDCITLYFKKDKIMFTGDFLFEWTVGRVDLLGGDMTSMYDSINKIKKYPKDITIYPGHGNMSTLENEHKYNDYFL